MSIAAGTRLGPYVIEAPLGAGGMGEVYRARDSKLGRSVAIKVLPAALADDVERIGRFEREARALAALNHPRIATLFGLEESDHQTHRHLLVMELVDGETLAERLRQGPLPPETALALAQQIAEALEAAHEKGIIHRDLKPANVKITPDDQVKVLDFGLAKALGTEPGSGKADAMNSPTLTLGATQAGLILGTAAYMSPEQARGYAADHRSDIFAFGVVLFEMLTGRQPFKGDTVSDVLASVLARDVDLGSLPATLNPRLPDLVRRCLEKSPKRRWQAIGDVRAEIEIIAASPRALPPPPAHAPPAPAAGLWKRALPAVGLALGASVVTAAIMWAGRTQAPSPIVTRFAVTLDVKDDFRGMSRAMLAVSPDGKTIVFSAGTPAMLYVRHMGDLQARPIHGSDEAGSTPTGPLFSPDGRSVAYWSSVDQSLRRIPVDGGAPVMICKTELPSGASWTADGLVFVNTEGIQRVAADGQPPETLVKLADNENAFGPQLLPGGRTLIFTTAPAGGSGEKWERARLVAQPLPSGVRKTILEGGADARYVAPGYLVFARAGVLFAAPFDAGRLAVTGKEAAVVEGVRRGSGTIGSAGANYSVSDTGTLVYIPGPLSTIMSRLHLALFDRHGVTEALDVAPGPYQLPRLSPDGRRIAFESDDGRDANIWVYDVGSKQAARRLTFGGRNRSPAWSADSERVTFESDRDSRPGIFWQRADGTGTPERLTTADTGAEQQPLSWAPSGDLLLFDEIVNGRTALWAFSLRDRRTSRLKGIESTQLTGAVFSPDGRWVAYSAREPGRSNAVYVEPFPQTGAKYQISDSAEDGHHPLWSPDGAEVFYTPGPGTRLTRVPVVTSPGFSYGAPSIIERPFTNTAGSAGRTYDITRDGKRFIGLTEQLSDAGRAAPPQILVVLNWLEELRQRVPLAK
jgi:eukaryotic-like serine/threonine-protein kinase